MHNFSRFSSHQGAVLAAWHRQAKVSSLKKKMGVGRWRKWRGTKEAVGEGSPNQLFIVPSSKHKEGGLRKAYEGARGGKETWFFFPLVFQDYLEIKTRGSFSASLEGQPRDWLRFWGCLCKVGFLLQCIPSEVLHMWTGTVNTDANTVWGARKCLLIFVGGKKSILITYCIKGESGGEW